MTTFRCPSDILFTSCWLFTTRRCTWPRHHLVPCVAELVESCVPIHTCRGISDPKCLFDPSGLSLCLPGEWRPLHFRTVPVDDMVLFHSMVSDGGLVNYATLPSSEAQVCVPAVKEATSLWCSFIDMYESGCRILPTQPYMGPGDFCVTYSVTL